MTLLHLANKVDLRSLNTFAVPSTAEYFLSITAQDQIPDLLDHIEHHSQHLFLGSGSNLLLMSHLPLLICQVKLIGINYHDEKSDTIQVTVSAGENWHRLVMKTLSDGYSGLENLALIPGTVGAAPVQNIGAYGVELQHCFKSLKALDLLTQKIIEFSKVDCQFSYRDSHFKQNIGRFLILSVTLELSKKPQLKLDYQPIKDAFANREENQISAVEVARQVIHIRSQKLPDPDNLGNAGSFFKNPIVEKAELEELKARFPKIIAYDLGNDKVKLAAGWLIDNLGFKGYREGDAGVHQEQALVLVNHGNATGEQIFQLSENLKRSVFENYGVRLEREVRVVGELSS